jgi:hypothetical protein
MFLRENKFEIEGLDQQRYKKVAGKKSEEKTDSSAKIEPKSEQHTKAKHETEESQSPTLM